MKAKDIKAVFIVFLLFFLTSTGYIAWLYRLMNFLDADKVDLITMGLAYFLQAVGILIFSLITRRKRSFAGARSFAIIMVFYLLSIVPAVLGQNLLLVISGGLVSNLICGLLAAFYLHYLTTHADNNLRATCFGAGYELSAVFTWLFSFVFGDEVYSSLYILLLCLILGAISVTIVITDKTEEKEFIQLNTSDDKVTRNRIILAMVVVALISLVDYVGFTFTSADIGNGVVLELTRVIYAAGLLIAGIINDRSRKLGGVITIMMLIIPFVILALKGVQASATTLWILAYFAMGFFAVYRVIILSDMAIDLGLIYIAGFGLMTGRIGESAGVVISGAAAGNKTVLIILSAFLYIITIPVFYKMYTLIYGGNSEEERKKHVRFWDFSSRYDLTSREQEVLKLILEDKTNNEIIDQLVVSESTVKFHIHNILKKTGCKNRNELRSKYETTP